MQDGGIGSVINQFRQKKIRAGCPDHELSDFRKGSGRFLFLVVFRLGAAFWTFGKVLFDFCNRFRM